MLATRIIPTLLCRGRTLVKGQQFNSWRSVGNVAQAVRVHAMRGVDELVLLDIGATREGRRHDLALVEELAEVMTTPLAVGGGIRTVEDVRELLRHGADKVVIRSSGTELVRRVADAVGCQAIVAAIDVSGTEPSVYDDPEQWQRCARHWQRAGAGEIMLTRMGREGMMNGYDLELIRVVSEAVNIPVIAHGGCGTPEHMLQAIQAGAHAVAAGSLFLFTDTTPADCARYLEQHGVEVRLRHEEVA